MKKTPRSVVHYFLHDMKFKNKFMITHLILVLFPTLIVFLFLYGRELWGIFAYLLDDIFEYFWTAFSFLGQFLLIFFVSETVIFFLVILYMSLLRHMSHERLKKKLFVFQTGKEWKKKWTWDLYLSK